MHSKHFVEVHIVSALKDPGPLALFLSGEPSWGAAAVLQARQVGIHDGNHRVPALCILKHASWEVHLEQWLLLAEEGWLATACMKRNCMCLRIYVQDSAGRSLEPALHHGETCAEQVAGIHRTQACVPKLTLSHHEILWYFSTRFATTLIRRIPNLIVCQAWRSVSASALLGHIIIIMSGTCHLRLLETRARSCCYAVHGRRCETSLLPVLGGHSAHGRQCITAFSLIGLPLQVMTCTVLHSRLSLLFFVMKFATNLMDTSIGISCCDPIGWHLNCTVLTWSKVMPISC